MGVWSPHEDSNPGQEITSFPLCQLSYRGLAYAERFELPCYRFGDGCFPVSHAYMVGVAGFEPATPCSQSKCSVLTELHTDNLLTRHHYGSNSSFVKSITVYAGSCSYALRRLR